MTVIDPQDVVESVELALQTISWRLPTDFLRALGRAHRLEESDIARDAMARILANARLCAEHKRPICQDTGVVIAFIDVGMDIRWSAPMSIEDMVNEGARRAYTSTRNPLRCSMVDDPANSRTNTRDNSPAVVHTRLVPGQRVRVKVAAKGGGSQNKARFAVLNPSDRVADWVVSTVETLGAGWCPPGILGLGIGGTPEKAMLLAEEALLSPIDMEELIRRGPCNQLEELRIDIYERVNALGIGAQGCGGLTTVLDVKIMDFPTHAASLPVALIPNCVAARHVEFELDGSGPASFASPDLDAWPMVDADTPRNARHVDLDTINREDIRHWRTGEQIMLSGRVLTARDAAHKRIADLLQSGQALPQGLDFTNRFVYYVGPVPPAGDEVIGPAGPTTASRMDAFTELMLGRTGLIGMIGKAERGPAAVEAIRKHGAVYLIMVGGAAYLASRSIRSSRVVAFPELGMEAVHEFVIENLPATVAVDVDGNSIHETGPATWKREREVEHGAGETSAE